MLISLLKSTEAINNFKKTKRPKTFLFSALFLDLISLSVLIHQIVIPMTKSDPFGIIMDHRALDNRRNPLNALYAPFNVNFIT